ncbi:serine/threonine-protein kinase [Streptomyces sp. NPDC048297]|uniref:serine/threonine-protein kinase n=1 Tax=Streptomyces sp. NPDC048297 TaxID=3365531 RepID=UPI00371574FA
MAPQRNTGAGAEAELPEYAGHYRLESCLGSGGMGVVQLARSPSGMKLAVKVVHAEFARDPEFRGRFRQEVAAARRVSGAFTAPVVDADPEAERPWMATLFIPGPTLSEQVKRNGPMSAGQLRRLMAGLAEALRDIHRVGVVHRDLKPSNVLLAEDGPKVIDFGISRPKDSELRTETGKLIGTPPFMAPEQFRRPREVGPAADVFALGSVLVHAATGRGPFDSDSPYVVAYQVVHDEPDLTGVPESLAPLVLRCLAKDPDQRPTPDELMRELRSVAASYDTQAFIPAQRKAQPADPEPRAESDDPGPRAEDDDPKSRAPRSRASKSRDPQSRTPGSRALGSRALRARSGESAPAKRERVRRKAVLGAGALGLGLVGVLAAVQFAGDGPAPASSRASTPRADGPWAVKAAPGGSGMPQCSYGGGQLLCARSGVVYALSPTDGSQLWRHSAAVQDMSGAPVLAGGLVQPHTGGGARLSALRPASGEEVWSHAVPAGTQVRYVGGTALLTGADGTVTALDAASGSTRWSHPVGGLVAPSFTSFPGDPLAYATNTSGDGSRTLVTAVDPETGLVRWQEWLSGTLRPVGSAGGAVVLLSVDQVYGTARAVVRFTPGTGVTHRVDLPVALDGAQAAVRGDTVYLLAAGGLLQAVDMADLRLTWRLETSVSRGSPPVADGRHVYFTASDGRLLAVDAHDGTLVGQTRARLGARATRVMGAPPAPLLGDGRVYATAPDGTVFAVNGRDPAAW